jgi:trigger factor
MQVKKSSIGDSQLRITIIPSKSELAAIEEQVLIHMSDHVKVPGFREGKAPAAMVAKHADPNKLQSEFLDHAVNQLYVSAIESEKIRPVDQPQIAIKKFVPFTDLEFDAEIEVIGDIVLPDYKKIKLEKQVVKVTPKDVNEVLESLRERAAEKKEVTRAAKDGDEVVIDFSGTDPVTNKKVAGADGKDYPLILGSQSFIPGFEKELAGLKPGAEKTFDIVFPKDYNVSSLQGKKTTFKVTIKKIQELTKPPLDNNFVEKVSPFKTQAELKDDIKKQLAAENQTKADRGFESELISKIAAESKATVPRSLVDQQIQRMESEERQNLTYRGQTWQEHLDDEGVTEEEHRERNRPMAEQNVKASLVLSDIAEKENISVTPEEADIRLQILKGQYQDRQMQEELDKPENRQSIVNQILTEKTFKKLVDYATKK